jgi:SWI/SNF-related matrix-associated actin-dependent regulator 1 of chromatin subfamily A
MNKNPKPYQIDGIRFLAANDFALLGDDAGLGKSMQMILAANQKNAARIIIICQAIGRVSWRLQCQEWDTTRRPVFMVPDQTAGPIPDGPVVLIVTVDWLSVKGNAAKLRAMLDAAQPMDAAFVDEAHNLKTPSAARTKGAYGKRLDLGLDAVLHGIRIVWVASATFTPLNVTEIYTHLRALFPDRLATLFSGKVPTLWEFTQRFAKTQQTPFGMKIVGNNRDTIPQLRAMMKPIFLMRLKTDVLSELPPIQTALIGLDVPKSARPAFTPATEDEIAAMSDAEFLAYAQNLAAANPAYSTARADLGVAKVNAVWPWIGDFLTNQRDKKLIVFAHHKRVVHALQTAADLSSVDAVALYGGTNDRENRLSVERFQNDLACRLFVGQTRAAGTSITLTAAHHVLLLEPDPSPLNNYQAISRAHRIGQKDTVFANFAFVNGDPIDTRMATTLRRRSTDFEQLFGAALPGSV